MGGPPQMEAVFI